MIRCTGNSLDADGMPILRLATYHDHVILQFLYKKEAELFKQTCATVAANIEGSLGWMYLMVSCVLCSPSGSLLAELDRLSQFYTVCTYRWGL